MPTCQDCGSNGGTLFCRCGTCFHIVCVQCNDTYNCEHCSTGFLQHMSSNPIDYPIDEDEDRITPQE